MTLLGPAQPRDPAEALRAAREHLVFLYGEPAGQAAFERLLALTEHYRRLLPGPATRGVGDAALTARDAILITYPDQVREPQLPPLQTLAAFCERHLAGLVSGLHLLPFYPSSSDDGFAVMDYRAVDPAFGGWDDIRRLAGRWRLMFDAVINHVSAQGAWFQAFLQGDPNYRDWFLTVSGEPDLSRVVRPRALPLLTEFETAAGPQRVWTTFSADQVDLNYHNPDVLLEIVDLLLFYAAQGARLMRLDAIAFLWKEIGTTCLHLPQTHRAIQLLRAVLDAVAPDVVLITETNVPHGENVSYWGDGAHEAQLVYNFALPPLVLHSLLTGRARALSAWAADLARPSAGLVSPAEQLRSGPGLSGTARVTFFNFLASHDGIGLNPVRGILAEADIGALVREALARGGLVSYKHNADGSQSPYELNINYLVALADPGSGEPLERQVDRFMVSQAIMLSLAGVPGIYFHSLFGSRGWPEGVRQTGRSRTINRQKLDRTALEAELAHAGSLRRLVFDRYARLLRARASAAAFDPYGVQVVHDCGEAIFAVERAAPGGGAPVLCLHNVSAQPQRVTLPLRAASWLDVVADRPLHLDRDGTVDLAPYQVLWFLPGME